MKKSIYFQQARKITVNKLKTIKKFTLVFMLLWIFLWSGFANIADPNDWPFWEGFTIFTITAIVLLGIVSLGTFLMTLLLTLSKKKMSNSINSILGVTIGVILIKIGGIAISTIFYLNDNRNPFPLNEQFTSSFIFLVPIIATILIFAYIGWTTNDSIISETC